MLGADFQNLRLPLGPDPDHENSLAIPELIATLLRYCPAESIDSSTDSGQPVSEFSKRPAILWVHGLSDYFFQAHVAEAFHAAGYAFYALDLRKCGRSLLAGQSPHWVSNLELYYEELNLAAQLIQDFGHRFLVPLGHSTGGLILALWVADLPRQTSGQATKLSKFIKALILNSPWTDFQYPLLKARGILAISLVLGKIWPKMPIDDGGLDLYGESIHRNFHGEWDYDLKLKPLAGHQKYLGWLRSVLLGQRRIRRGGLNIQIPVLTLCAADSFKPQQYSSRVQYADVVLDSSQIQNRAPLMGPRSSLYVLEGAIHDVFLSRSPVRETALQQSFEWLSQTSS